MLASEKTNSGMLPQSRTLEFTSVDKPRGGYETGCGRGRKAATGMRHGREETTREGGVTPTASGREGDRRVFVLDKRGNPLMPTSSARARQLLRGGRAVVHRHTPFVIRLRDRVGGAVQPVRLGIDPGSKTTGMAVYEQTGGHRQILFLMELSHRSDAIRLKMEKRAAYRRRRRSANLRYRQPRFNNRTRPKGWLTPSLYSRVQHIKTWARRLSAWCPVGGVDLELVRFDTHLMANPAVSGAGYQHGTLYGYEVREYVLEKWGRRCTYCDAENVPLNLDHVVPRARGGSDRSSNLVPACIPCNQAKGATPVEKFAPDRADRILRQAKLPLKDAAAVNSTRFAVLGALRGLELEVDCWSGGRTKWNRHQTGTSKTHALDAACCGEVDRLSHRMPALPVKAMGRGDHCRTRTDAYGFARLRLPRVKSVRGFQTGDLVVAVVPSGKSRGRHVGRVAVRTKGSFRVGTRDGINHKYCTILQRSDGYAY